MCSKICLPLQFLGSVDFNFWNSLINISASPDWINLVASASPALLCDLGSWPSHSPPIPLYFLNNPLAEGCPHLDLVSQVQHLEEGVWGSGLKSCHCLQFSIVLFASGVFLLFTSHQLDPDPLSTTLSLSVQPVFNPSNGLFVQPLLLQLIDEKRGKWFKKACSNVFQEAVLHDLFRDSGYWPVVSCIFLLAFPRGVALAIYQHQGPPLTPWWRWWVVITWANSFSTLTWMPYHLMFWIRSEKTITSSSPSAGSSFLCMQWFGSKLYIQRLKGKVCLVVEH